MKLPVRRAWRRVRVGTGARRGWRLLGSSRRLTLLANRVHLLMARGKRAEAIEAMRVVVAAHEAKGRPMDVPHLQAVHNLGMVLNLSGRFAEAEPVLLAEYERLTALLPAGHGLLAQARRTVADAYATNGRPEQAAAWRAR